VCASYVHPEEFRKSLWAPGLIFSGRRLLPRQLKRIRSIEDWNLTWDERPLAGTFRQRRRAAPCGGSNPDCHLRQGVCAGERHDSVLAEPPGRPREFVCYKEGLAYRNSSWSTKGCLEGPCEEEPSEESHQRWTVKGAPENMKAELLFS
jgi:hypothetical protein